MKPRVLVIDDNPSVGIALEVLLSLRDIETVVAHSAKEGLERLRSGDIALVIQDMNFEADTTSGEEGERLFHAVRELAPEMPIILLTAWTRLESAVALVKSGAADYLAKPWDDNRLLTTVSNLLELGEHRRSALQKERALKRRAQELSERFDLRGLIYADPLMEQTVKTACQFAKSQLPVLILGPNGCGKEKLAELMHANSAAKEGPWIPVNCGAIPSSLLESELFGVRAGAYTGATEDRMGKFEAAHGGTLFLDEIGTLSLEGQVKLLRVLESGTFCRVGEHREREVNVRLVSATNADLGSMIQGGAFRQDLWYRINTLELKVPSLQERPEDVIALALHFLQGRKALGSSARRKLLAYPWPGNVRELRNVIERAALLTRGESLAIEELQDRPAPHKQGSRTILDRASIEGSLRRNGGVVSKAAAELGLSRQALYRRMEKAGIRRKDS